MKKVYKNVSLLNVLFLLAFLALQGAYAMPGQGAGNPRPRKRQRSASEESVFNAPPLWRGIAKFVPDDECLPLMRISKVAYKALKTEYIFDRKCDRDGDIDGYCDITEEFVNRAACSAHLHLHTITLRASAKKLKGGINFFSETFPSLKKIILDFRSESFNPVDLVPDFCASDDSIENVDELVFAHVESSDWYDLFAAVMKKFPNLKTIRFKKSPFISNILEECYRCYRNKKVILVKVETIDLGDSVYPLFLVDSMFHCFPTLKKVKIKRLQVEAANPALLRDNSDVLTERLKVCEVEELELLNNNQALEILCNYCAQGPMGKSLKILDLRGSGVTVDNLSDLSLMFPNLEKTDIGNTPTVCRGLF